MGVGVPCTHTQTHKHHIHTFVNILAVTSFWTDSTQLETFNISSNLDSAQGVKYCTSTSNIEKE